MIFYSVDNQRCSKALRNKYSEEKRIVILSGSAEGSGQKYMLRNTFADSKVRFSEIICIMTLVQSHMIRIIINNLE